MRNVEKYKTAQERAETFLDWCVAKTDFSKCKNCVIVHDCDYCPARGMAYWLDLEAEVEKPLPCPFCGGECELVGIPPCTGAASVFNVKCEYCSYISGNDSQIADEAISAHNRVAKAVWESEVNHG